ncbi:AAA family ATPase (plasmid) [Halobiforma lacisalsi AJ5]|uniref:AAA family ATPase n=1 Tax=Natronobacterium lacisalsi AJ5 TaxID=358396 RepID=M0LDI9_NATLA|nr:AAA family ATPase [Halobiforma lacisalsi]APX00265.1 AAA family ATPase [Halobiforma lacisalsi AJ5]EMA30000.1 ATPase AAA [Halobiforma lacisalsi AJ5]
MEFDSESFTSGQILIQRLEEYNPWWERSREASLTGEYSSLQNIFHQTYDDLHQQQRRLIPITGPDGAGKSALLKQLVSAHIDPDFVEKFVRDADRREQAQDHLVPPSNVLYIPLRDDPVFQLQPEDQLRAAVDHFETHVLRRPRSSPHYILLDDLHTIERPNKRGNQDIGRWERLLTDLIAEHDERRIVFTALSRGAVRERFEETDVAEVNEGPLGETRELYPMGFSDFLKMRYRDIELAPSTERFDENAVRKALREAVETGDADRFVAEIEAQNGDAITDSSTVRREIANYCTSGGTLTLRIAGDDVSIDEEQFVDIIRGRDDVDFESHQRELLTDFRNDLLHATTNLGGVKDALGLERFCALTAHEHPTGDVRFDELTDVLDVDRRTLRDKYLRVLSRLHLLSAAQEYDNQRPRKLRFYLRDPGITNAFCRNDLNDVLRREPGLDEALAKAVAFDHTIRLSNELNHPHDPKRGVVKFWAGSKESVDFVFKLNGTPIPMLWSYNRGLDELQRSVDTPEFDALQEFLEGDAWESEQDRVDELLYSSVPDSFAKQRREYVQDEQYAGTLDDGGTSVLDGEPAFGVVLTNARESLDDGISVVDDGAKPIIQIPLWVYLRL